MNNSKVKIAIVVGLLMIGLLSVPLLRKAPETTPAEPAPVQTMVPMATAIPAAAPAVWLTSLDKALKQAKTSNKPILIDFQADWCGPCHMLREQVFEAPIFQPQSSRFVLLSIDVDKQPDLAMKYGASSLPMLLVLDAKGKPVLSTKGYRDPAFTIEYLEEAHKRAAKKS